MFYRSSSHFIVKIILLKFRFIKVLFYFLKGIGSTLKPFSLPFNLQLNPPIKKALFKNYRLN